MQKIKNLIISYRKFFTVALSTFVFLVIISAIGHHVFYKWLHEDGPFAPYMMKVHAIEHSIFGQFNHSEHNEHSNHSEMPRTNTGNDHSNSTGYHSQNNKHSDHHVH